MLNKPKSKSGLGLLSNSKKYYKVYALDGYDTFHKTFDTKAEAVAEVKLMSDSRTNMRLRKRKNKENKNEKENNNFNYSTLFGNGFSRYAVIRVL